MVESPKIAVFDFFSGAGGASCGFRNAGLSIALALDSDPEAAATYASNFGEAEFLCKPIQSLTDEDIWPVLERHGGSLKLFCGCAPCQPFTRQKTHRRKRDVRAPLLEAFGELVRRWKPELVFVENVPGMQRLRKGRGPLRHFLRLLETSNYHFALGVVAAQDYGVAQCRRRLVLVASRLGRMALPAPTHGPGRPHPYRTVRNAIADIPAIGAGDAYGDSSRYPNHRAARLSAVNMARVRATPHDGGSRADWPATLQLECHTRKHDNGGTHSGHTDVYGRMIWDRPASGLTTRCISLSNGRFGHPEQDRAISVREAARIQGFPDSFVFSGSLNSMARQIGNAVPVELAEAFGRHFLAHASIHWWEA